MLQQINVPNIILAVLFRERRRWGINLVVLVRLAQNQAINLGRAENLPNNENQPRLMQNPFQRNLLEHPPLLHAPLIRNPIQLGLPAILDFTIPNQYIPEFQAVFRRLGHHNVLQPMGRNQGQDGIHEDQNEEAEYTYQTRTLPNPLPDIEFPVPFRVRILRNPHNLPPLAEVHNRPNPFAIAHYHAHPLLPPPPPNGTPSGSLPGSLPEPSPGSSSGPPSEPPRPPMPPLPR